MTIFENNSVENVIIDKHTWWLWNIFLSHGENYVLIQTKNKEEYKFYCSGLEEDAFDENWTEETIDGLYYCLKGKEINCDYRLDIKV